MADSATPSDRPRFSVVQASLRTGKARSTIQRYLRKGAFPNAYQEPDGTWSIPVEDLLANGLRVDAPTPADHVEHGHAPGGADPARIAELETALAQALARAAAAEQIAAERDRIIEAQAQALRMLTAGTGTATHGDTVHATPQPPPRSRGLLGRIVDAIGG
ncbi:hypothetical protein ACWELP_28090 [Rhodococcus aetherivorans]